MSNKRSENSAGNDKTNLYLNQSIVYLLFDDDEGGGGAGIALD